MVASNQQLASDADDQDRLFGLLSYILAVVVPIIILVTDMKARPFRRFHAINALSLDVAVLVIYIVLCICLFVASIVLSNVPGVGGLAGLLTGCVPALVILAYIGLRIWYAVLAYQGKYFDIPFLTNFARQQRWI